MAGAGAGAGAEATGAGRRTGTALGLIGSDVSAVWPFINRVTLMPGVSVGTTSSGFRSASVILPSDDASAMRSASLGMTASVTTDEGVGWRSFACAWSILVPAVRTSTLPTTVRVIVSSAWPCPRSVTTTSTRVPGATKPATPTTSSTLTEMARIPGGIDGGRPAPDPIGASLVSVSGSFSPIVMINPRFTTSFAAANDPCTGFRDGQATSLTSFSATFVPVGRLWAATTTNVCATSTYRTPSLLMARYTPTLATVAIIVATN